MSKVMKRSSIMLVGVCTVFYFLFVFYISFPERSGKLIKNEHKSSFVSAVVDTSRKQLQLWTPDDILVPRLFNDDTPSYQEGYWSVTRHNTRLMRDNLSRMRTTDGLNEHLVKAFNLAAIDTEAFMFPSSKKSYNECLDHLESYNEDVASGKANFYPRADNLVEVIEQYMSELGGICTKLNNAVEFNTKYIDGANVKQRVVSWFEIDNNFYYAQGVAHALHWSMKGIRDDFNDILIDKNSVELCDAVLDTLSKCQIPVIVVTNGGTHSLIPLANKSLQLSSYLQDARQKMHSMISSLKDG